MMKGILAIALVFTLVCHQVKSYAGPMEDGFGYEDIEAMMNSLESQKRPKTDQERAEKIQAQMIETLFLAPIFKNSEIFNDKDEDEDEESMVQSSGGNQLYKAVMMRELAKDMAKKDMLKMNKQMIKLNQGG
jgi:hypothetical protein